MCGSEVHTGQVLYGHTATLSSSLSPRYAATKGTSELFPMAPKAWISQARVCPARLFRMLEIKACSTANMADKDVDASAIRRSPALGRHWIGPVHQSLSGMPQGMERKP